MKQIDIKDLATDELVENLMEQKAQLEKLKLNHAVSPLENPMLIRGVRRVVARLETEITKRNNNA